MRLFVATVLCLTCIVAVGCRNRDEAPGSPAASPTVLAATNTPVPATVIVTARAQPATSPPPSVPPDGFARAPGTHERSLALDGRTRGYLVHIPPGVEAAGPLPLVLVLHGGGGNANQVRRSTGFDAVADEYGFIAVFPHGNGRLSDEFLLTWNAGNCCSYARDAGIDDVSFLRATVAAVVEEFGGDPGRIFATGMSNGGMMGYRLACDAADLFLGVAPVAGALNLDCQPSRPISLLAIHGTDDLHVLYEGGEPIERADPAPRIDTSVADSVGFFVEHDRCLPDAATSMPAISQDVTVVVDEWTGCTDGTRVALYTLQGGVHEWPGDRRATVARDLDASRLIWEFFSSLPSR